MGKIPIYYTVDGIEIIGRESQKENDLFFTCSLIDYIARKTKNRRVDVVDALFAAYHSFVSDKIDDYNSSFYYDAPQNILNAFLDGKIE